MKSDVSGRITVVLVLLFIHTCFVSCKCYGESFFDKLTVEKVDSVVLKDGDTLDKVLLVSEGGRVSIEKGANIRVDGGGIVCLGEQALGDEPLSFNVEGVGSQHFYGLHFPYVRRVKLENCSFINLKLLPVPSGDELPRLTTVESYLGFFSSGHDDEYRSCITAVLEAKTLHLANCTFNGIEIGAPSDEVRMQENTSEWDLPANRSGGLLCSNETVIRDSVIERVHFKLTDMLEIASVLVYSLFTRDSVSDSEQGMSEYCRKQLERELEPDEKALFEKEGKWPVSVCIGCEIKNCQLGSYSGPAAVAVRSQFEEIWFQSDAFVAGQRAFIFDSCSISKVWKLESVLSPIFGYPNATVSGLFAGKGFLSNCRIKLTLPGKTLEDTVYRAEVMSVFSGQYVRITNCEILSEYSAPIFVFWSGVESLGSPEVLVSKCSAVGLSGSVNSPTLLITAESAKVDISDCLFYSDRTFRVSVRYSQESSVGFTSNSFVARDIILGGPSLDANVRRPLNANFSENLFICDRLDVDCSPFNSNTVFCTSLHTGFVFAKDNMIPECKRVLIRGIDLSVRKAWEKMNPVDVARFGPNTPYYDDTRFEKITAEQIESANNAREAAKAKAAKALKQLGGK
ncbi:MAG: hypothetical protein U5N86_10520 [Planctomycetota bacterium]|nr:hypothetical protein [Planctomycetota bacterium]